MPGYVRQKTTVGVKSAIGVYMDHAFQANHVRANEDPEFVYHLIKWLDVNHDKYKNDFKYADMLSIKNLVLFLDNGALQPLHPGVIRYLKEKGLWKAKYQARQDALVKLAQGREKAYKAAMAEAEKKGISIDPGDAQWRALWQNYRKTHGMAKPFGEEVLSLP